MAVHAKKAVKGQGRVGFEVKAADILCSAHALHPMFVRWLAGKPASRRQAREFLREHPHYRNAKQA